MLQELMRKIRNLASRAVINLIDASGEAQVLQLSLPGTEAIDDIELLETYGLTSHPHAGSEALTLSLNGNRQHTICILAGGRKFRIKGLKEGEVCLYTDEGDVIHFQRDKKILIKGQAEVNVETPIATFSENTRVKGNVQIDGNLIVNGTSDLIGKMTADNGASSVGGITVKTLKVTGVTPGGGVSGEPQ